MREEEKNGQYVCFLIYLPFQDLCLLRRELNKKYYQDHYFVRQKNIIHQLINRHGQ